MKRFTPWFLIVSLFLMGAISTGGPIISGAASSIVSTNLTANRVLESNAQGKVTASSRTSTQLSYLDATSSVQTQLNAKLALAGGTLTGPLVLAADPTGALEPVTLQYLEAYVQGLNPKAVVKVATTGNITLSGEQTIDGVLTSSSRVLVKNQSTPALNGIYVSNSGSWNRASDMNTWVRTVGAYTFATHGTLNGKTGWVSLTSAGGTLGTTAITIEQFAAAASYTADGNGLELSGTQFALELDGSTLTKGSSGLKVSDATLASKAAASHTHAASEIASGVLGTARLGTGTASSSNFLRGDGSWAIPPGSSTLGHLRFYGSPGRASTNTTIVQWSTADSDNDGGLDLQMVKSSSAGDYIETLRAGNYSLNTQIMAGASGAVIQLMAAASLTNSMTSSESGIRATLNMGPSTYVPLSWSGYLPANTKIWIGANNTITTTYPMLLQFSVIRLN